MKTKIKTNEQSFKELFKELNSVEVALLRERILKIFEITLDDIKNNPENWNGIFVHPRLYIELNETIQKHLAFKD